MGPMGPWGLGPWAHGPQGPGPKQKQERRHKNEDITKQTVVMLCCCWVAKLAWTLLCSGWTAGAGVAGCGVSPSMFGCVIGLFIDLLGCCCRCLVDLLPSNFSLYTSPDCTSMCFLCFLSSLSPLVVSHSQMSAASSKNLDWDKLTRTWAKMDTDSHYQDNVWAQSTCPCRARS